MSFAINLLPPEYLPRRSLPKGAIIALALGGLLLTLYLIFLVQWGLASRRAALLEDQLALYEPQAQQAATSKSAISEWQQKERELQRLVKERRRWQPVLAAINDALPREIWLARLEANEAKGELILAGGSTSLQAIGNFLNNLQASGLWQAVNLQEVKGNDGNLVFTFQAVFKGTRPETGKSETARAVPAPGDATKANPDSINANKEGNSK
ncbi:Fimbrial assembly PilN [Moorella glycerini]|uniref:Fimbrial assembly protein PilN n=1 Tax=Neomoorella stamsii TaxID=1266720 RepID=A0A9X7P7M4_9FIRM|nr:MULTISPECIES: PilN domain-containing protein [Moorella]PRR77741.1 Fimbrial assembly protein PilN [Moorella stamsii]CEP66042.1 Fimbrial assembly PilN [Moorella glycerini]